MLTDNNYHRIMLSKKSIGSFSLANFFNIIGIVIIEPFFYGFSIFFHTRPHICKKESITYSTISFLYLVIHIMINNL